MPGTSVTYLELLVASVGCQVWMALLLEESHSLPRVTMGLSSFSFYSEWLYLGSGIYFLDSIHSLLRLCSQEQSPIEPTLQFGRNLRPCQMPMDGLCFPCWIELLNPLFWHLAVIFPPGTPAKKSFSDLITFRKCAVWLMGGHGMWLSPWGFQPHPWVSHELVCPVHSREVWLHRFLLSPCVCYL